MAGHQGAHADRERAEKAPRTLLFLWLLSLQVSSQAFCKVSSVPTAVCLLSEGRASSHACQHATVSKPLNSPAAVHSLIPRIPVCLAYEMLNLLSCPAPGSPTPPLAAEEIPACFSLAKAGLLHTSWMLC